MPRFDHRRFREVVGGVEVFAGGASSAGAPIDPGARIERLR